MVLDRIYDYSVPRNYYNLENEKSFASNGLTKYYESKVKRINQSYRNYEKLIRRYSNLRPGLKIKEEAILSAYNGQKVKMVKIIVNEKTEEIKKEILSENKVYEIVLKEFAKYPRIASRTDRVKLALAVIAYSEVSKGIRPSFTGIAKKFGISIVNLRKAYSIMKKYKDLYRNLNHIIRESVKVHEKVCYQRNNKQAALGSAL
ncbi:MAG: hypothetical protein B6U76_01755 [Desulfurococcales archaeon ex4484_217_2]|nr:MAG: hypothetical protein B6U76_01755 [Desulfurococcales archaeon ex4484_217_2]